MMLPLKKLVTFYMYAVSCGLLALAHYTSYQYVDAEKAITLENESDNFILEDHEGIKRLAAHLVIQCVISASIIYLINLKSWMKYTLMMYISPMIARVFGMPVMQLHIVHNFSSVFSVMMVVMFLFNHIPHVLDTFKTGLHKMHMAVQMYGWIPFIVAIWFKILLPVQFLVFWLALFTVQLFKYFSISNHPIFAEGWLVVLLASVGECCVTPISLMGVCVTVSYMAYFVLSITKFYLLGHEALVNDNVMHRGWTEGFTMFLLAIQTGLIELKAPQRAFLMSIVLFIVLSSLIQSVYEITDPILLSLGASQSRAVFKHARAIFLCTLLWILPLYMTHLICQFFDLDFWLLVVVSSCVLTSVQVLGSMAVYALFMYDAVQENPWESLDDVVYYAKATTRVLEFIVAVFVVCYGVQESLFGEWSWVNSSILLVHCYFNVWQRLQAGWKSYLMRREAVKKIQSLPQASAEELEKLSDVCAICFQELQTARITPCGHFYHGLCLRKWLYVQDNCPMCHQKISEHSPENTQNMQNHHHQENLQHNANDVRHRPNNNEAQQNNTDSDSDIHDNSNGDDSQTCDTSVNNNPEVAASDHTDKTLSPEETYKHSKMSSHHGHPPGSACDCAVGESGFEMVCNCNKRNVGGTDEPNQS